MNLTDFVRQVSLEDFGCDFRHQAYWNKRLRTTGGRFFPNDGHLDFNPKHLEVYGEAIFRQIVRHELCHYHLYFQGKGYKHQDRDFKQLLKEVDGIRFAPKLQEISYKHTYYCQNCGQIYPRRRRIDLKKYRCGRCQGKLSDENIANQS
ncbi:SprT family protein [Streptococcus thoraltensis]|uniref:SprT family protein n=1 Tax=Streptococcus thoraltensis TaxID=55085 RepID=UPI000365E2F9|nr:SprT family protein [Streptococcus thoraltensis]MDY4762239.1 SprT family protein [Streptococcus thoraltensis]